MGKNFGFYWLRVSGISELFVLDLIKFLRIGSSGSGYTKHTATWRARSSLCGAAETSGLSTAGGASCSHIPSGEARALTGAGSGSRFFQRHLAADFTHRRMIQLCFSLQFWRQSFLPLRWLSTVGLMNLFRLMELNFFFRGKISSNSSQCRVWLIDLFEN